MSTEVTCQRTLSAYGCVKFLQYVLSPMGNTNLIRTILAEIEQSDLEKWAEQIIIGTDVLIVFQGKINEYRPSQTLLPEWLTRIRINRQSLDVFNVEVSHFDADEEKLRYAERRAGLLVRQNQGERRECAMDYNGNRWGTLRLLELCCGKISQTLLSTMSTSDHTKFLICRTSYDEFTMACHKRSPYEEEATHLKFESDDFPLDFESIIVIHVDEDFWTLRVALPNPNAAEKLTSEFLAGQILSEDTDVELKFNEFTRNQLVRCIGVDDVALLKAPGSFIQYRHLSDESAIHCRYFLNLNDDSVWIGKNDLSPLQRLIMVFELTGVTACKVLNAEHYLIEGLNAAQCQLLKTIC